MCEGSKGIDGRNVLSIRSDGSTVYRELNIATAWVMTIRMVKHQFELLN